MCAVRFLCQACKENRTACIIPDENGAPTGICNLCGGDPECVKNCPYDAIQYVEIDSQRPYYAWPADKIAAELSQKFYGEKFKGGM